MSGLAGLLRFQGRLNRRGYGIGLIVYLLAALGVLVSASYVFNPAGGTIDGLRLAAALVLFFYITAVIMIGRLHDRDKSGWWYVVFGPLPFILFFVSAKLPVFFPDTTEGFRNAEILSLLLQINAIGLFLWGLLSLAFMPGTKGDNRFGSAP
ncbi:MAG: hypothetical protein A4S14_09850 [Proteobacteria bacterium SG_bin9]|nr:MAG: hypothetical protein A4S14_09850 [Proteobacteria bacterium SG_bin9]